VARFQANSAFLMQRHYFSHLRFSEFSVTEFSVMWWTAPA
jgi:hypothetical protein